MDSDPISLSIDIATSRDTATTALRALVQTVARQAAQDWHRDQVTRLTDSAERHPTTENNYDETTQRS